MDRLIKDSLQILTLPVQHAPALSLMISLHSRHHAAPLQIPQ